MKKDKRSNMETPAGTDASALKTIAPASMGARRSRWPWAHRSETDAVQAPLAGAARHPNARLFRTHSLGILLVVLATGLLAVSTASAAEKIRVLIITGGHDFETNAFLEIFKANPDITFEAVAHPDPIAHAKLRPDAAKNFDVIVLYDMWQKITEEAKTDLVNFLKAGNGLVSLHHSIANYQSWPEWPRIVGGRYYLQKTLVDGVEKPPSIWKHDVKFKVHVADPDHPVTRGVKDFEIHDETYGLFDMGTNSHALLTTEEPTSARNIAWAKTYDSFLSASRPPRVVYIQLGHDHLSYENPNYQRLVKQAIRWAAKRD
jgi:uncharacterized protein